MWGKMVTVLRITLSDGTCSIISPADKVPPRSKAKFPAAENKHDNDDIRLSEGVKNSLIVRASTSHHHSLLQKSESMLMLTLIYDSHCALERLYLHLCCAVLQLQDQSLKFPCLLSLLTFFCFSLFTHVVFLCPDSNRTGKRIVLSPEQGVFGFGSDELLAGDEDEDDIFNPWVSSCL